MKSKKVVVGGFLPTMMPERCRGLFDAVVVGEGDELWPQILADIEAGRLRAGWWRTNQRFYSLPSIARRVLRPRAPNRLINLGQNLVFRSKVRRGVHPVYFNA